MQISDQSPDEPEVRNHAGAALTEPIADEELRVIRILQHRGRLVVRDGGSSVQRLVEAGLVRAVERPGAEVILVLSGDGLRLAHWAH